MTNFTPKEQDFTTAVISASLTELFSESSREGKVLSGLPPYRPNRSAVLREPSAVVARCLPTLLIQRVMHNAHPVWSRYSGSRKRSIFKELTKKRTSKLIRAATCQDSLELSVCNCNRRGSWRISLWS